MTASVLDMAAPILLAALGGLFTELAGVLNIALEGLMVTGAFTAVIITQVTGSMIIGSLGAVAAGALFAFIFGFITLRLRANIFITGLAANLLASGLTNYLSAVFFGTKGVLRFEGFPEFMKIAGLNPVTYISGAFTFFSFWLIYKTVLGLRIRAAGLNRSVARNKGVDIYGIQLKSLTISGAACGLAGAALSLKLGAYIPGMISGRGWIALVAIYLGGRHPAGILLTSIVFAGAEYFSNSAQGFFQSSSDLLMSIPYTVTLTGMIIFSKVNKNRTGDK